MHSAKIELTKCTRHAILLCGPFFLLPATLIHCHGCILGAMLFQCKPRPVVHRQSGDVGLVEGQVSDGYAFVFPTQAAAIMQHKACECRAGKVINLAAASKWLSTHCVPDSVRDGRRSCLYDHPIVFTGRKKKVQKKIKS